MCITCMLGALGGEKSVAGVTDGCEPAVGAWNGTQVLFRSSKCSLLLSRLFSPSITFYLLLLIFNINRLNRCLFCFLA